MSKSRKILSAVLALVMVLGVMSVSAFAATVYTDTSAKQTWALSEPNKISETQYSVDVILTTTYKAGPIQFVLTNTNSTYVVLNKEATTIGSSIAGFAELTVGANSGAVKFVIVPQTEGKTILPGVQYDNTVIATVVYDVEDSTKSATIALEQNPKTEANPAGTLIVSHKEDIISSEDDLLGQIVEYGTVSQNIGVSDSDLVLKEGAQAGIVIDKDKTLGGLYDGLVYGFVKVNNTTFRSKTYITNSLEADNGGSIEITPSSGTAFCGTGTIITVKNAGGQVCKTYAVVIFGDTNGDGFINANDAPAAKKNLSAWNKTNTLLNFAANCQAVATPLMLYTLNANDLTAIKNYAAGKANKFSETDLAAKQLANKTYYK